MSYEIIQVDSTSWRIEENGVRSLLFCGKNKSLLVDSGFGTGNIRETTDSLTNLPIMLVNTHADRDHIGCNMLFEKAFMHPAEYHRYEEKTEIVSESEIGAKAATEANAKAGEAIPVLCPLWEGDIIDLGGRSFEVLFLPGHTPGSIALLDGQNRILISGDTVQTGGIFMFGSGRNLDAYINSMEKLLAMGNRFDTIYPSHGPFPLNTDVLHDLLEGAKRLQKGALEETEPPFELPAKLYAFGAARFLY